jgi:methyl-accepting chemotaxis protein
MSGIRSKTGTASGDQASAKVLSGAYESWLSNDDQNNMYAALVALRDPSQHKLAEATWGQSAADYQDTVQQLTKLRGLLTDRDELAQVAKLRSTLASYNGFSLQLRKQAVAGNVHKAVYIMTVANLAPSNALPVAFTKLRNELQASAADSQSAVRSSAKTGMWVVLILLALTAPLLLLLVVTTIRSIVSRVGVIVSHLKSLVDHEATDLQTSLQRLADGDLTYETTPVTPEIENVTTDELGQIAGAVNAIRDRTVGSVEAYNQTRESLRGMIGRVAETAESVGSSSQEMAATSQEAGRATGEIAHAVESIAQGAEQQVRVVANAQQTAQEVSRAVTEAAENAQFTAELAQEARSVAEEGVSAAEQASSAMHAVRDSSATVTEAIQQLASQSDQIGQIVQTITGIAEQTNLLALNAAIEAARAGEQGKGFAVVAEEVRKLAEESQKAAQKIGELISAIQGETTKTVAVVEDSARRTEDGAVVVERTRDAFQRIGGAVEDMSSRIGQIAATSQQIASSAANMQEHITEVAAVADDSSASTEEVSASAEQTSASAQQIAASAQELATNAERLTQLVSHFKTVE